MVVARKTRTVFNVVVAFGAIALSTLVISRFSDIFLDPKIHGQIIPTSSYHISFGNALESIANLKANVSGTIYLERKNSINPILTKDNPENPLLLNESADGREQVAAKITDLPESSRCQRIRRKSYSKWFDARYNQKITPIWSRENIGLSPEVDKWWRYLQKGRSKEVNMNNVMNQLFNLTGRPDHDDPFQLDASKCVRCAVVGNAGNLINSHYGPQIDGHDLVIRINNGPVKGFEKDVGRRTTHRFQYPETANDIPDETHLVLVPFKPLDVQWLISALTTQHITRTRKEVKKTIKVNKSKILVYHPAFFKYVRDKWMEGHGHYPSTGAMVLIFSLHACDQVDVYGFGPNKFGNWDHYWSKNYSGARPNNHDKNFEVKLLQKLQEENVLSVHKPH